MEKKVMMDQPRQERRRRALERFSIKPMAPTIKLTKGEKPEVTKERDENRKAVHAAYVERKNLELRQLQKHLGVH